MLAYVAIGVAVAGLALPVVGYARKLWRIHRQSLPYTAAPSVFLEYVDATLYLVREVLNVGRSVQECFWDGFRYQCVVARRMGSFVTQVLHECSVVLVDREMSRRLLADTVNLRKGFVYDLLDRWLADGLLTGGRGGGERWRKMRRLVNPVFHRGTLNRHNATIIAQAERFARSLAAARGGDEVDVRLCTAPLTLAILFRSVLGVDVSDVGDDRIDEYVRAVHTLTVLFTERSIKPHYWFRPIYSWTSSGRLEARALAQINGFVDAMVERRRAALAAQPDLAGDALMDTLIIEHARRPADVTVEDIRNEVNTFMFAGHDTSSVALSFTLFVVASMPDVQQRILHEVLTAVGVGGGDSGSPAHSGGTPGALPEDCLPQLKYTEAVVKECLRLFPPVPLIARKLEHDLDLGKGPISAGTNVVVAISALHMDPQLFPRPDEFQPERFLSADNVPGFMPFSAGPRSCIGQRLALNELVLTTATVVKNCVLQARGYRDEIIVAMEIVLRSKKPLIVAVKARSY